VTLAGLRIGRRAILVSAVASALLWNFAFIPPRFTFTIGTTEDRLMFLAFFVVALATGRITQRLRSNERILALREARAAALYRLTRELASAGGTAAALDTAVALFSELFDAEVAILVKRRRGRARPCIRAALPAAGRRPSSRAGWRSTAGPPAPRPTRSPPRAASTSPSSRGAGPRA
jgi:two-component system sensor histidine kinase KdpD